MSIAYRSERDAGEAYDVGRESVRLAVTGATDQMVVLRRYSDEPYGCAVESAPLAPIANEQRLLPAEYINPSGNGVTEAFRRYALPLLGGPLPRHARLTHTTPSPSGRGGVMRK
jgi:hypothetical protein